MSLTQVRESLWTILPSEEKEEHFNSILDALKVNERKNLFEANTIYELLVKLNEQNNQQIKLILEAIEKKESVQRSLEALEAYLKGGTEQQLKAHLDERYGANLEPLVDHFFTPHVLKESTRNFLRKLGIFVPEKPRNQEDPEEIVSIYQLLEDSAAEGHTQLIPLLELLDEKKDQYKRFKHFAFLICAIALLVGLFLLSPSLPGLLDGFITTSNSLLHNAKKAIFFIGISENFLAVLYSIRQIYNNPREHINNKDRDMIVSVAKTFLYLAAWGVWLLLKAGMAPVITAIFIFSSLLELAKELYCLYRGEKNDYENHKGKYQLAYNHYSQAQVNLRYDNEQKMHQSALKINACAAASEIAITLCWGFLASGGILVSVISIIAFAVVYAIQYYALQRNALAYRVRFQEELAKISVDDEKKFDDVTKETSIDKSAATNSAINNTVPSDSQSSWSFLPSLNPFSWWFYPSTASTSTADTTSLLPK
jgi:hypothetical protein